MKKIALFSIMLVLIFSCEKKTNLKELKTAYVDTSKLMDEYSESKQISEKYKLKSSEMDKQLEAQANKLKSDKAYFQKNAQSKGEAWAQQEYVALQKRDQQLQYQQQQMLQQLQQESTAEMDTLVKKVKKFIKNYGKEKGYAYIYGTGETATVLYAEDKYDITKELTKLLNQKSGNQSKK